MKVLRFEIFQFMVLVHHMGLIPPYDGGILLCIKEDIPSNFITIYKEPIESLSVELN